MPLRTQLRHKAETQEENSIVRKGTMGPKRRGTNSWKERTAKEQDSGSHLQDGESQHCCPLHSKVLALFSR